MRNLRYVKKFKKNDTSYSNVKYRNDIRIYVNMRNKGNQ